MIRFVLHVTMLTFFMSLTDHIYRSVVDAAPRWQFLLASLAGAVLYRIVRAIVSRGFRRWKRRRV